MKKKIPTNYKKEIEILVSKGLRPFEIAEKLGLNKVSTQCYIKRIFNINFCRTYEIQNPDYFQNINTDQKAYWVGFICADGYLVNNPSKVIGIQLSEVDKESLIQFKKELGSKMPLRKIPKRLLTVNNKTYISKPCVRLHIGNTQMYDDLVSLGITPNKSKTLGNIINNIPYEFRDSFIVGYFDGDGAALNPKGKVKKETGIWYPSHCTQINIRGTEPLLQGILDHLEINKNLVYHKTYILNLARKSEIIRFLKCYNNLNYFLKRKHDKLIKRTAHPSYDKFIQVQTISSSYP